MDGFGNSGGLAQHSLYNAHTAINTLVLLSDIGANLTDGMYQGHYHGKQKHEGLCPAISVHVQCLYKWMVFDVCLVC